jgi:hypothetical protein
MKTSGRTAFIVLIALLVILLVVAANGLMTPNGPMAPTVTMAPTATKVPKVPRRIVQTWKTLDLGRLEPVARTWRTRNPDFEYVLYDDAACARTVAQLGPRVEEAYGRIGPGAFKADLWRYCELYVAGGVYVDIDTVCLSAIDDVIDPAATLAVPIDLEPPNLFNAFIAVRPGHPVMRACIDAVVENVERGAQQTGLAFSGPALLGACVSRFLGTSSFEPGLMAPMAPFVTSAPMAPMAPMAPAAPMAPKEPTQFLKFDPVTEIVSSADDNSLMQNKNGNSGIYAAYEAEAKRAAVVRYEM